MSEYVGQAGPSTRARGVRIHRLLELINAEVTYEQVLRLSAIVAPEWDEAERATIASEIMALVENERWIWQFPSHAEVNIAGTILVNGEAMSISGQIDRVVMMPDGITVIDYKTGRHVPKDASDISETYRLQMKSYQALLRDIWPGKPIRCAILWTAAPTLMWCDEAVEQTAWPIRRAS